MTQSRQPAVPVRGSTRDLLLDTAEQLFAEFGIEAVSLRSVGQQAGQRNNSVAQYHFGSRAGLVKAIIERRSAPIDARRRELLAELETSRSAHALVRIFVLPLAEAVGTASAPTWYLRFLAQVVEQRDEETNRLLDTDPTALREVRRELRRLLDQPDATFARRQRWMAQVTLRVLADQEREAAAGRGSAPDDAVVTDLVTMLVALLEAP